MMRCPNCEIDYPTERVVCPQCAVPLASFTTNRMIPPTEQVPHRETTRLTGSLPGPARATTSFSPVFTGQLAQSNSPPRVWLAVSALIGLAFIGGLWLSENFTRLSGTKFSLATLAGELRADRTPASDELVQFIERSLENNLITSSANPLLTPEERTELVIESLEELQDPDIRQQIAHDHHALAQQLKQQGLGKEAWYEHIAACQKVCLAAFSALTSRHFTKVSQNVHSVVFFNVGSTQLDSASRRDLQQVVALMSNRIYANRRILLIGRASRGGAHGYNMALSERRVRAVRAELVRWGVAPERIKTFWLGWEQPYLTPEVAKLYRVPTYLFDNDEVKLNQSVELVLY